MFESRLPHQNIKGQLWAGPLLFYGAEGGTRPSFGFHSSPSLARHCSPTPSLPGASCTLVLANRSAFRRCGYAAGHPVRLAQAPVFLAYGYILYPHPRLSLGVQALRLRRRLESVRVPTSDIKLKKPAETERLAYFNLVPKGGLEPPRMASNQLNFKDFSYDFLMLGPVWGLNSIICIAASLRKLPG